VSHISPYNTSQPLVKFPYAYILYHYLIYPIHF